MNAQETTNISVVLKYFDGCNYGLLQRESPDPGSCTEAPDGVLQATPGRGALLAAAGA